MNRKQSVHQQACDVQKSVHLSASAGSGKTRALKDRYLALLDALNRQGLSVDQAVAITFTDKAAAEIKERVLKDLPEPMLRKIIRGRQDLRISTIHSFCMSLLKRYPLEAGLPPDFGVIDARDRAYLIQKAVEDALDAASRDSKLMAPLSGATADELTALVEYLLSLRSRLTRLEIDAGGPEALIRALLDEARFTTTARETAALLENAGWRSMFRSMEAILRGQGASYDVQKGPQHALLAAAPDRNAAFQAARSLASVYFTRKNEPRKKPPLSRAGFRQREKSAYPAYEELFFRIQQELGGFLAACRQLQAVSEAVSLLRIEQLADERYRDAKLQAGLLDFDDLEIYAYRLLQSKESPEILYWLDRRILHVLVDEFQDTSDIQWAVVNKLTEETFSGMGAEKGMPPTLFVVGDEKQSIYRFR